MSVYPIPSNNSSVYNPENFTQDENITYGNLHYLSRLGLATSEAATTTFSGSIIGDSTLNITGASTLGIVNTSGLLSCSNGLSVSNGLSSDTMTLSGNSNVPTKTTTDSSANIATTQFVQNNISLCPRLESANTFTALNTFSNGLSVSGGINTDTLTISTSSTVPTLSYTDSSQNIASTAYVNNCIQTQSFTISGNSSYSGNNVFLNNTTYGTQITNLQSTGTTQTGFNVLSTIYGYNTNSYSIITSNTLVN